MDELTKNYVIYLDSAVFNRNEDFKSILDYYPVGLLTDVEKHSTGIICRMPDFLNS